MNTYNQVKPISPKVIVKSLAQDRPSSNLLDKKSLFSVNDDGGGNFILSLEKNRNGDAEMIEEDTDRDFFSGNEMGSGLTQMNTEPPLTNNKRTYSTFGVDDVELDSGRVLNNGDMPAKSAKLHDDKRTSESEVFNNQGRSRILLIKSADNHNIFANPNQTLKFLESSGLDKIKVGPHEVQGRGGCLKVTVSLNSDYDFKSLVKFGDHNLKLWFPASNTNSIGVISPIDQDVTLENIFAGLTIPDNNSNSVVVELKRLIDKDGPTDLIKIIFEGELPKKVAVYGQIYKVRKYKRNPLMCYRCSRWGHGVITCTGSMKCGYCGGNHMLKDCEKKGSPKCLQCNSAHVTGSKSCFYYDEALKIEALKSQNRVTYEQSKDLYNDLNNKKFATLQSKIINKYTNFQSNQLKGNSNAKVNNSTVRLSNFYDPISDDTDTDLDLDDPILDSIYHNKSYSEALKSKKRKKFKKKIQAKPFDLRSDDLVESNLAGNCHIDSTYNNSVAPHSEVILNTQVNQNANDNNDDNSKTENCNLSSNQSKVDNSNQSNFSFFLSILEKLYKFAQIKDKSYQDYGNIAWEIFNEIAQFFNFKF